MNQEVELGSFTNLETSPEILQNVNIVPNDDDENSCVICLEGLDKERSIHFRCGHIFHIQCILEWIYNLFEKNTDISCPVCRSIECHSTSPYYNIMKRAVGYNGQQYNYNIEVQQRHHNNNIDISSSQHRMYQNNQRIIDEGLRKGFFRFMMCFTVIMVGFFCFLIYAVKTKR